MNIFTNYKSLLKYKITNHILLQSATAMIAVCLVGKYLLAGYSGYGVIFDQGVFVNFPFSEISPYFHHGVLGWPSCVMKKIYKIERNCFCTLPRRLLRTVPSRVQLLAATVD